MELDQFRRTMLPYLDDAYTFARYLTRDSTQAEDIVQQAFLRALRGFDRWRGDNPRAWLFSIVRNCCMDSLAQKRDPLRAAEPLEAIDDHRGSVEELERPEDSAERNEEVALVRRTIESLPEPFRETVVLRELEELSYREIASVTGVPIGTVMSRLARARQMLAALLLPAIEGEAQA